MTRARGVRCALVCGALAAAWAPARPARAAVHAPKLAVVVRPTDPRATGAAEQIAEAVHKVLKAGDIYAPVDVDVALQGAELARARKELAAAHNKVQRGRTALHDLEVREATTLLRQAVTTLKEQAAYLSDPSDLAEALMYLGAIQLLQKKRAAGRKLLAQAAAIVPELEPDPRIFNPPMRKELGEITTRARESHGWLTISSKPSGARAFVDGRFVGLTPVSGKLVRAGIHSVRVMAGGTKSWGKIVEVAPRAQVRTFAKLESGQRLRKLAEQISETYRAAAAGKGAPEQAAKLAVALSVTRVLLVRVRKVRRARGAAITPGTPVAVDAALYTVSEERLARTSRSFVLPSQQGDLEREIQSLVDQLRPPPVALLVELGNQTNRDDLEREAKAVLTEALTTLGGSTSFVTQPLDPECLAEVACVREVSASLDVDAVLAITLKTAGPRLKISLGAYSSRTGQQVLDVQEKVASDQLAPSLRHFVALLVDALWEARVSEAGGDVVPPIPGEPEETIDLTARLLEPSGSSQPTVLDAPVPEQAEPTDWERILGWATAGAGLAIATTGLVVVLDRNAVLEDPRSSAREKEQAHGVGLAGLVIGITGLAVAGFGGWLTWSSYQPDDAELHPDDHP